MEEDILLKKKNKAQRDGNVQTLADVQKKLGDLFYGKKCYEEALEAYKGQLHACECLSDKLNCAIAHRMIGEVQADIGNFNEALSHQNLYLEIAKNLEDLTEEQRAYATLGRTYLLVADNFIKESEMDEKMKTLKDAKKAFSKSIRLCDKLENKIDVNELMMMRARLLLNLGLVLEQQKDTEQALNLIKQAASLCKKHNLHEDLHRTNIALAGINERLGNTETAIRNLDDAAKIDDIYLKADARLLKAELFLRLGEWIEAKKILHNLYKSKKLQEVVRLSVVKLLKIAVLLCRNEDQLLTEENSSIKEKLYESMGDAAIAVRSLDKAAYYYRNMLTCAEEAKSNQIAAALTSLVQTLRDAGKFQEAIPYASRELKLCKDAKDICNSALYLAGLLIDANSPDKEIRQMFETALVSAKEIRDSSLERTVAIDFRNYLKDLDKVDVKEIASLNELLDSLPCSISDETECEEGEEDVESPDIGNDICLDDLSDTESEVSNYPSTNVCNFVTSRRPRCVVKKNEKGESQLHVACIKGNIGAVEKLLDEQHPTAVRDHCGWTPLHEASNHGFVEIVRLMVRAGADVNDPGGVNCDGFTALHDAAANGHTAVVHLLLDSGANANLLTRGGESALDCLEQWRERVGMLSPSEVKDYEHAKRRLSSLVTVRPKKKCKKNKDERRWNALVDEDDDERINKESVSVESWVRPEKISAGEDYKRTIASMQHPGRLNLKDNKAASLPKITAPLIDSEDLLIGDWLEEDMTNKRQEKFFSSSGILATAQPSKRKSKNDSDHEIERQVEKSAKRPKISSNNQSDSVSAQLSENSCDKNSGDSVMDYFNEVWPKRKKPRQTSLLKQGFSKVLDSRSPSSSILLLEELTNPTASVKLDRRSWDSGTVSETLDLNIQVDKEAFDLKLHFRDLGKTMSDIEDLIRHKFEAKTGCRPRLNFTTVEGIALAAEVTLEEVVREKQNLRLIGQITQNDLPSIVERYKKVCETSSIEVTDSMLKSLKSCDNTSAFRLSTDSVLEELEPLIKCLHYHKNLQMLNLSGATLFESGELLNHAIAQLPNLCELHLQCCDIDLECLNKIEKLPAEIRVLDLSYNPVGGDSQRKLYDLIEPLRRLQTLYLRYCELAHFEFSYTNHALVNLDISWNPIGGYGAANLLQRQLLSLNLSNTQNFQSNSINVIDKIFFKDSPRFSLSTLESLDLSSCQATDLDVEKILSQTPNLSKINLSNNINVTKTSLCALLGKKPTMTCINLSGCKLINGLPDANIKIISPQVCTLYVHMTMDVIDAWERLWQGKGYSKKLPHDLIIFKPL